MATTLKARWRRWFERKSLPAAQQQADGPQPTQLEQAAARAEQKARQPMIVRKMRQTWADVQVLVRLVRAYARGDYRQVSRATIVLIVAALTYFVSPIDAILDHLPFTGLLDDAAILAWVVAEVRAEIEAFRAWEQTAQAPRLPAPESTPAA